MGILGFSWRLQRPFQERLLAQACLRLVTLVYRGMLGMLTSGRSAARRPTECDRNHQMKGTRARDQEFLILETRFKSPLFVDILHGKISVVGIFHNAWSLWSLQPCPIILVRGRWFTIAIVNTCAARM